MKHLITSILTIAFATITTTLFADETKKENVYMIWPSGKMPGTSAPEYKLNERKMVSAIKTPTLELFLVKSDVPTPFVIVFPGGGYNILAHDHEGVQIAEWLNSIGVSAGILRYRVPQNPEGALQDAQRAIKVVRQNADKVYWNIDPQKIGVIGFSAGANLCARLSTNYKKLAYDRIDNIDVTRSNSARPDFTMLIYPAYCDEQGYERRWNKTKVDFKADYNKLYKIAKNLPIDKKTPPVFIAQSLDDKNYINAGIAYFLEAKRVGVPANLHIFEKGGHGYGLADGRYSGKGIQSAWTKLAEDWLKSKGFAPSK